MASQVTEPTREELVSELAVVIDELHRTRAELERAKNALAATVSQDLRTPLASIQGYVELLEDGELGRLSPSTTTAVRTIGRNAARLATLLDDLVQTPPQAVPTVEPDFELSEVDLGDLVRQSQVTLQSVARRRQLDLSVTLEPRSRRIRADRDRLEQVVLHLVGNALKFTPEGGRVAVTVDGTSDGVALVVTDTGIGIPADEIGSLFSRFFRSSLSVNRGLEGEGLGLSVTKSIVEAHGGHIAVDSTEGVGTTVRVELLADPQAQGAFAEWRRSHHRPANGRTNGTNP